MEIELKKTSVKKRINQKENWVRDNKEILELMKKTFIV
jgi:hypothetical protein